MKQAKKSRLLAMLLAVIILLSMLPTVAFAEENESKLAEQCTVTEGCTLEEGHERECAFAESETESAAELAEAEDTEEAVEEQVETLSESGITTFDELIMAINNVENGGTVTLAGDIAGNVEVSSNKQFTLNLNGKTLNGQIKISNADANVSIQNGIVTHNGENLAAATILISAGKAILSDNLTVNATSTSGKSIAIAVVSTGELEANGVNVGSNDWGIGLLNSAQANLTNMNVLTGGNPISTSAAQSDPSMNVTIDGGTYKCTNANGNWSYVGIYWASHGTLNIKNGTFTSLSPEAASLFVKNGTVNIDNGNFTGTKDGLKITSEQVDSTEIEVNINGGNFAGIRSGLYIKTTATGNAKNDKFSVTVKDGVFDNIYTSIKDFSPQVSFEGGSFIKGDGWFSDETNHWYNRNDSDAIAYKAEHIFKRIVDKEATAAQNGSKHEECTLCHYQKAAVEIPALGHDYKEEWSSDEANHWHDCNDCDERADKAEHIFEWIVDKEATAVQNGSKHEECTVCHYKKAAVEIPALGHDYKEEWSSDETNHWHDCNDCDGRADKAEHIFKWIVDKEATAAQNGSKHEECTVCHYKKAAIEIPALGGNTGNPGKPSGGNTSNSGKPSGGSPQTGDNSHVALWISLLAVSLIGLLATLLAMKKKNYRGN